MSTSERWRRPHPASTAATLLPVCLIPKTAAASTEELPVPDVTAVNRSSRPGVIEIEIAGAQLRLRGAVDETMLGGVLRALRRSQ